MSRLPRQSREEVAQTRLGTLDGQVNPAPNQQPRDDLSCHRRTAMGRVMTALLSKPCVRSPWGLGQINSMVEGKGGAMTCTHFDAFRFFAPEAR